MRKLTMIWTAVLALASFGFVRTANAQVNTDAPGVARVSMTRGDVSMQRGDSGDTSAVDLNTPLVPGDKVFTGSGSRAEVQLDWANIMRLDQNAEMNIATLDRTRIQVQLSQGLANFSVLKGSEADVEINTPNVAVVPRGEGRYRIEVNYNGDTLVTVREGEADITTSGGSTPLRRGQLITVRGSGDDAQFQIASAPSNDDFDNWNNDRDRIITSAESYRRTNRYYTGASDLDAYGSWRNVPDYGSVWVPRVSAGWAPYRQGRWNWQSYYGWTWIGAEPWGWAPYHYGRWFVNNNSWVWWPGPVTPYYRPVYAPAYVSFFGFGGRGSSLSVGVSFGGGFGSIGWLPAGPGDYVNPWWGSHRNNFNVVNVTNITNIYNVRNVNAIAPLRGGNRDSNIHNVFGNDRVRNGLSTVSAENFGRGRADVRNVSNAELRQGQFMTGNVPVVPSRDSLRASDRQVNNPASSRPPAQERFFSKRMPSSQRESFSDQSAQVQQAIDRDSRFRPSPNGANNGAPNVVNGQGAGNRNADNRNAGNQPAGNGGGFGAPSTLGRTGNAAEVNSSRQNQPAAQAQTPASDAGRGPTAGWRRFGSGQGTSTDPQSNQRAPVLRAPQQNAATSETAQSRADAPENQPRPAQNDTRPPANRPQTPATGSGQRQASLPRLNSQRMAPNNNSERPATQPSAQDATPFQRFGNQGPGSLGSTNAGPSSVDRPNGFQRFSDAPRTDSTPRGAGGGNQVNTPPSPRSDNRPPLELNRPIIQQRGFGGGERTAPSQSSPSNNTRVAPAPRTAPDTPQRSFGGSVQSAPRESSPNSNARVAPSPRSAPQSMSRPQGNSGGGGGSGARSAPSASSSRSRASENSQGHR